MSAKADVVIVGLGNPGTRYAESLHNVGFKVVDQLAKQEGWLWKKESRFLAEVAKGRVGDVNYHLLKPYTYMNLSGEAVKGYLDYYRMSPEQLVVIVDDADLLTGELRLKPFGGSGGHNGIKSIEKEIGTQNFKRLRIGIGRDRELPLAEYVLAAVDAETWKRLEGAIFSACELLKQLAKENFEAVMKTANTLPKGEKNETR